ncbi:MAG: hypothetical protein PF572_06380 [Patescibacteria group bacterium]|jgi:hypothetical protein|nr:hypothetical protein [Patescibacteria group bacterium]
MQDKSIQNGDDTSGESGEPQRFNTSAFSALEQLGKTNDVETSPEGESEINIDVIKSRIEGLETESLGETDKIEIELESIKNQLKNTSDNPEATINKGDEILSSLNTKLIKAFEDSSQKVISTLESEKKKIDSFLRKDKGFESNDLMELKSKISSMLTHIYKTRRNLNQAKRDVTKHLQRINLSPVVDNVTEPESINTIKENPDVELLSFDELVNKIRGLAGDDNSIKTKNGIFTTEKLEQLIYAVLNRTEFEGTKKNISSVPAEFGIRDTVEELRKIYISVVKEVNNDLAEGSIQPDEENIIQLTEEVDKIKNLSIEDIAKKFLLYNDIADPSNQNEDLSYPNIRKYAKSLKELAENKELAKALEKIRREYDVAMAGINLDSSTIGNSQSWIYWDLAKQHYYNTHKDETDPKYLIDDPVENIELQNQIADRHLGWEVYDAVNSKKVNINELNHIIGSPLYEEIDALLSKSPNELKTISSFDLSKIGSLIRKSIHDREGGFETDLNNEGVSEVREETVNDLKDSEIIKKEETITENEVKLSKKELDFLENELGIKLESLEKIEGFGDLSTGQQTLVMNNIKQILSGINHSEAVSQQAEEFNKKEWLSRKVFGKLWSSITKSLEIASKEKSNLSKIKEDNMAETGLEQPKDYEIIMKQLILGMKNFGPEVDIVEGKTEVRYANIDEKYTDEEKNIVNKFNKDAYGVSRMPKSWLFDKKYKDAYKYRMGRYEESKKAWIELLKSKIDTKGEELKINEALKEIALKENNINASLNINQYLNTNPDVEEELLRVKNDKWYKQVADSALGENGMYFASGAIARTCAVASLGASAAAAPFAGLAIVPVAGGIGLVRGRSRARKSLLEKDIQAGEKGNKFRERRRAETKEEYEIEEDNFFKENWKGDKFREKNEDENEDEYRNERIKYFNKNELKFREIIKEENEGEYRDERRKYYEMNKESNNFVSGVDLTDKIDYHFNKIEEANSEEFSEKYLEEHSEEELKILKIKLVDKLETRLEYTKKKIDEGLIFFSSPKDEVTEMISLYESISKARVSIATNREDGDDFENRMKEISEIYLSTKSEIEELYKNLNSKDFEDESENLSKIKELIKLYPEIAKVVIANLEGDSSIPEENEENQKTDIDLMKTELVKYIKNNFREKDKDENKLKYDPSYDKRFTGMLLRRIRVDSNLESLLKKKAEEIDKARKKYLFDAGVHGAVIGSAFATAGYAIRHWFGDKIAEVAQDAYHKSVDSGKGLFSGIFGNGSVNDNNILPPGGLKLESVQQTASPEISTPQAKAAIPRTDTSPKVDTNKVTEGGLSETSQNPGEPSTEPPVSGTKAGDNLLNNDILHNGKELLPKVSGNIDSATIREVEILENGKERHDTIIGALTRQLEEKSEEFGYKASDGDIGKWASAKANNIAANSGYFDGEMDTKVGSAGIQHAAYQLEMDKDGNFTVHEKFKEGDGKFQSIERHGKTIGEAESTGKGLEKYEYSGHNDHADSLPDSGDTISTSPTVESDVIINDLPEVHATSVSQGITDADSSSSPSLMDGENSFLTPLDAGFSKEFLGENLKYVSTVQNPERQIEILNLIKEVPNGESLVLDKSQVNNILPGFDKTGDIFGKVKMMIDGKGIHLKIDGRHIFDMKVLIDESGKIHHNKYWGDWADHFQKMDKEGGKKVLASLLESSKYDDPSIAYSGEKTPDSLLPNEALHNKNIDDALHQLGENKESTSRPTVVQVDATQINTPVSVEPDGEVVPSEGVKDAPEEGTVSPLEKSVAPDLVQDNLELADGFKNLGFSESDNNEIVKAIIENKTEFFTGINYGTIADYSENMEKGIIRIEYQGDFKLKSIEINVKEKSIDFVKSNGQPETSSWKEAGIDSIEKFKQFINKATTDITINR